METTDSFSFRYEMCYGVTMTPRGNLEVKIMFHENILENTFF